MDVVALWMWWLSGCGGFVDVVALVDVVVCGCGGLRCGGSLVAHQTSGAGVLGSKSASTTMILMHCWIIL